VIADALLAEVYAHARATFPAECCGYLTATAVVRCTNAQPTGAHPIAPERGADTGFVIAGAELLAFARAFDSAEPPLVVYHSHTNGRAYFSSVDQAMADGPAYPVEHLVVGVTADGLTEAAQFAWSASERAYVEIARWRIEP
jgi:proteasome lid subunit RPN8/RPN11